MPTVAQEACADYSGCLSPKTPLASWVDLELEFENWIPVELFSLSSFQLTGPSFLSLSLRGGHHTPSSVPGFGDFERCLLQV